MGGVVEALVVAHPPPRQRPPVGQLGGLRPDQQQHQPTVADGQHRDVDRDRAGRHRRRARRRRGPVGRLARRLRRSPRPPAPPVSLRDARRRPRAARPEHARRHRVRGRRTRSSTRAPRRRTRAATASSAVALTHTSPASPTTTTRGRPASSRSAAELGRLLLAAHGVADREPRVAVSAVDALAHDRPDDRQVAVQLGAPGVGHAVHRPHPAVLGEVRRRRRVPVLGVDDGRARRRRRPRPRRR